VLCVVSCNYWIYWLASYAHKHILASITDNQTYRIADYCLQMLYVASLATAGVDSASQQMSSGFGCWRDCWCWCCCLLCCGITGRSSAWGSRECSGIFWHRWSRRWMCLDRWLHARLSTRYMLSTVAMAFAAAQRRTAVSAVVSEQSQTWRCVGKLSECLLSSVSLELSASSRWKQRQDFVLYLYFML